jgi:uncharacterized membrane protein
LESNFLAEIHTKVVHFPIALLVTYSFLEIVGITFNKEFITKSALLILCLGIISAFFAVLTGYQAADDFSLWNNESKLLLNEHQTYATYLLWGTILLCALRIYVTLKKKFKGAVKYLFILFSIAIIFLVYETGTHGGDLVKKYGVGTELLDSSNGK